MNEESMNHQSFQELFADIGADTPQISSSPYDTAWLARLDSFKTQALQWLRSHQLPDGSWGTDVPMYAHDRAVSTLAATATLRQAGTPINAPEIRLARDAVARYLQALKLDACGPTVGFELIVPSLLQEVQALGVQLDVDQDLLQRLIWARQAKLSALPDRKIDRRFTPSFSAELVGQDHLHLLDPSNLQANNGSVAFSPSASAFFARYVKPGDPDALAYLGDMINDQGAIPYVGPIEVFDHGWALWNLALAMPQGVDDDLQDLVDRSVKILCDEWQPGKGIASAIGLPLLDGDDTAIVLTALTHFGYEIDLDGLLAFQGAYNFRCYPLESDPSTSTNAHALHALTVFGKTLVDKAVRTAVNFLENTRTAGTFWFDKWHASPYYPTAHAIIALTGLVDELAEPAVRWFERTQRPDGSWGWYQGTSEETAYAVQALITRHKACGDVNKDAIRRGYSWLIRHSEDPHPQLWIGKVLYTPQVAVESAILSARMMFEALW
jgi:halimadienyl-diphosphate synthase